MIVVGQVRKGAYFDSVTLMQCGKKITAMAGVEDAAVVMGTQANRAILHDSGLLTPELNTAGDADLLVAIKAESQDAAKSALSAVDSILQQTGKKPAGNGEDNPVSMEGALRLLPDANLALISVAGRYAGQEAMRALQQGLHVLLFSDNVPLETEIELKQFASKQGLLLMGPDCGTAIINGVPLAFANVVSRGDIGIIAAAGTGLQEVSCIVSNHGGGISQAIGTGGRDVKKEVGGIMFVAALRTLAADQQTKVMVLISKPPHPEVIARIEAEIAQLRKPVVRMFVGAEERGADTLEEAALTAVAISRGEHAHQVTRSLAERDETIHQEAAQAARRLASTQRYVRGLFSGGTFCAEAQGLLSRILPDLFSNAPTAKARPLENSLQSVKNTLLDLGEDEFTVGRPHPMIDYTLRNRRIAAEAEDPATAVILLDVILGYGAHPDPAGELEAVIRHATGKVAVVCSVTGTDRDPQNRTAVTGQLAAAGAMVMPSNAAACKLAGYIAQSVEGC